MLPNWMWIREIKEVGGFFNSYMYYEFIKYRSNESFYYRFAIEVCNFKRD